MPITTAIQALMELQDFPLSPLVIAVGMIDHVTENLQ